MATKVGEVSGTAVVEVGEEKDQYKLALKHTLALVKAKQLNKDLLEYNKILENPNAEPTPVP